MQNLNSTKNVQLKKILLIECVLQHTTSQVFPWIFSHSLLLYLRRGDKSCVPIVRNRGLDKCINSSKLQGIRSPAKSPLFIFLGLGFYERPKICMKLLYIFSEKGSYVSLHFERFAYPKNIKQHSRSSCLPILYLYLNLSH